MGWLALGMELWGTHTGVWAWAADVPHTGLKAWNPPILVRPAVVPHPRHFPFFEPSRPTRPALEGRRADHHSLRAQVGAFYGFGDLLVNLAVDAAVGRGRKGDKKS